MRRLAAATCLLALPAAVPAVDCSNPVTTVDMTTCASRDFDAADTELNRVYKDVVAVLQKRATAWPKAPDQLRAAQRAWVAFRDANCTWAAGSMDGGTGQPVVDISCRTGMTRARVSELRALSKPYE